LIKKSNKNGHRLLFWIQYLYQQKTSRGGKAMSQIQLNPFFDFCRVKVIKQSLDQEKQMVTMTIHPDERYDPVCSHCQQKVKSIHSYHQRTVRDLNCFDSQTTLTARYRTVRCPRCGTRVEELNFVHPGKRVRLIIPVGLEKRIFGNLDEIVTRMNASESSGPRILPIPGEVFTEIDAILLLSGVKCDLVASGGVSGAEGAIWLNISGNEEKVNQIMDLINSILNEPPFEL